MNERWRPVVGWEAIYDVSNHGRVRRACAGHASPKGFVLTPSLMNGYPGLVLSRKGERKTVSVHKLVAQAFLPPRPGVTHVNHRDGDRTNNHVSNLEWATPKENTRHAWATGLCKARRGEDSGNAKLTVGKIRAIRRLWAARKGRRLPVTHELSQRSIAARYGISRGCVWHIVTQATWRHLDP